VTLGVWPGWNGTSLVCSDCGRAAAPIDRDVGVAIIGDLTYRFATGSDRSATSGGRSQCSRAVGECAARVAEMLTTLDLHLRQLSALDGSTCSTAAETTRSTTVMSTRGDVHASRGGLFEAAARLTWTIQGMTDACWHRPSTIDNASAAEMTWVALHHALHHFEDTTGAGTRAPLSIAAPSEPQRHTKWIGLLLTRRERAGR